MTNRNYIHGRNYEYRVAKKLREEGWTVLRTAGSHGFVDLIAIKKGDIDTVSYPDIGPLEKPRKVVGLGKIRLIQCKSGKSAKNAIKKVVDSDIKRWNGLYSVSVEVV